MWAGGENRALRTIETMATIHSVRGKRAFAAFRDGRSGRVAGLSVRVVERDDTGPAQVAYAIGTKVGTAVVRNRLRRRLRALVAASDNIRAGHSYLIGADRRAVDLDHRELSAGLERALVRAHEVPA